MTNAVSIIRVSRTNGREGESFHSPEVQHQRIVDACKTHKLKLIGEPFEEMDVSAGKPLDQRPGLLQAVEMIEDGSAEVVVAAYFDRLFRNLQTQAEAFQRISQAGGKVLAVDVGEVNGNGNAAEWASATMLGFMAEYQLRSTRERSSAALSRAVANGVPPWPQVTVGYLKQPDGRYVPDPDRAPIVAEAFERRAQGATIDEVRAYLSEHGVRMSVSGVRKLLKSTVVLGRIDFGDLHNPEAHKPIVERGTWERCQKMVVASGRKGKSGRLLARLGILRCSSCGSKLVLSATHQGRYEYYRCQGDDCERRVTISATVIEPLVVDAVKDTIADVEGRASAQTRVREAQDAADRARANYEAALSVLSDFTDAAAVQKLRELQHAAEEAQEHAEQLRPRHSGITINLARDWDDLSLDGRRDAIRLVIDRVDVAPGRGIDRVSVHPVQ